MSRYIGRSPQIGGYHKLDAITTDGSTAYTMQLDSANFTPESANHLIVSVNGVIQAPVDSFTVSGSTITFASALSSSDTIDFIMALGNTLDIGVPSDGTVTSSKISYPLTTFSSTGIDDNATSTAVTINSSEQVIIGGTTPENSSVRLEAQDATNPILQVKDTTSNIYCGIQAGNSNAILRAPNDAPLVFVVGSAEPERMRITQDGELLLGGTNSDYVDTGGIQPNGSGTQRMYGLRHTGTTSGIDLCNWNSGIAGGGLTSTGNFLQLVDGGNTRFKFKGDGNATCDGSFSGGGADYAEYFEWIDGNSNNEDRVGLSVVLDNGKIREATESDTNIIGVVSANPTVVGDEQPHHWQNKFVTDDFGRVQYETLTTWKWEIEDENGKTTDAFIEGRTDKEIPENAINVESFEHPYEMINPNYDETLEYTPRSQRQEWDCIGLMGKLRIKKGQQTNSNWIKIRDISDTVEEWLVR